MLSWHSVFCATALYFICWAECQRTACLILRLSLRPRSLTAILAPLLEALCLSLHQSSSFSFCCSSATEAASFESYTPNTQCWQLLLVIWSVAALTVYAILWQGNGWSCPMLLDHAAELAVQEQAHSLVLARCCSNCKLPRSIIGNNGPIITYYRPSNDG